LARAYVHDFGEKEQYKKPSIPIITLPDEAKERISYLKLDDYEVMYSLAIEGDNRLWGVIDNGIYFLVRSRTPGVS
jgi:hypothetical protein